METAAMGTRCQREGCHHVVAQVSGNHRPRQYCSDSCKQSDYRRRDKEKQFARRQAELREHWVDFLPETLEQLDLLLRERGLEAARHMAEVINRERGRQRNVEQRQNRESRLEQELVRYRQICDLSDRERLEQQFLDIGEQIGYRMLITADDVGVVGEGSEFCRAFAMEAGDDLLARTVVRARYYAENLVWVDAQTELKQAKRRIAELERQLAQSAL